MASRAALSRTVRLTQCSTISDSRPRAAGPVGSHRRLEGLKPNSPVSEAGSRIEPPASLAWASGTMPAATAAAAPPEEPPADRPGPHGFWVDPRSRDSVLPSRPNSELVVEHTICSPASSSRCT